MATGSLTTCSSKARGQRKAEFTYQGTLYFEFKQNFDVLMSEFLKAKNEFRLLKAHAN